MTTVFVYGTLKAGHGNHRLLTDSRVNYLGRKSLVGPYRMIDLGAFPGVVKISNNPNLSNTIFGELYSVPDDVFLALDMLEGHPDFYEREQLPLDSHGTTVHPNPWVYLLPRSYLTDRAVVTSGLWNATKDELAHYAVLNEAS